MPPKRKTVPKSASTKTTQTKRSASQLATRENNFYLVGMGASAGGLEAFEKFFRNMPNAPGMAFILVPHLDPKHISLMPELIQKCSKMQVIPVKDGQKVKPDAVYIVPPNKDLAILNGTLQLLVPAKTTGPRLPIDYFFRTLAEDQGAKAICIILSGMGTDGTLGLRAIKGELGMIMVQNPETAKYDSMPRSAIGTNLVDYILPPEKMPEQLTAYARHALHNTVQKRGPTEAEFPDALQKIFILLRTHTGHDFSAYKPNTIIRRIERRMNVHHIDTISTYIRYLQDNNIEVESLFRELLIGVTSFFRDNDAFVALKKALLKTLKAKPKDYVMRAWVPGCSTGEEAYSIAIILRECTEQLKQHIGIQIFATDIDVNAIETARAGVYPGSVSVDMSPERLKRFFIVEDQVYHIKKDIREMLVFAPQNIIKDPPFTKLDMVCCRNLLIYMDSELQKQLLPVFHYSLKSGGILFLGSSETIGGFTDLFSPVDKKWKIFTRKEVFSSTHAMAAFPVQSRVDKMPETENQREPELNVRQLAEKRLLETYAPASVVIKESGEILYIHGATGKYLELASGEAKLNAFEMIREGLKLELPSAVRKAASGHREVVYKDVAVVFEGGSQKINLTVKPMRNAKASQPLFMVLFEEIPPSGKEAPSSKKRVPKGLGHKGVDVVKRELQYTKETLQTTIVELETAYEELKSTNEELQSTNEELQSTNEELETSKEEQQSLNEELTTVNAELQGKIEELTATNNDMKNLLDSIEIPTIFLDNKLRIKRFTQNVTDVINLIHTDIGRPIGDIVTKFKEINITECAEAVLKDLVFRQKDVQTEDGRWYTMKVLPYRTLHNAIDGVVVIFSDVHEQKIAVENLRDLNREIEQARNYAECIIDTIREPFLVLNKELKVVSANPSFYRVFKVESEETIGRFVYEIGNRQWDIPKLRDFLEQIIPKNKSFEDFSVEHEFQNLGYKRMHLNAHRIDHKGKGERLILLAIEDDSRRNPS